MINCPVPECKHRCKTPETLVGHLMMQHIKYDLVKTILEMMKHGKKE